MIAVYQFLINAMILFNNKRFDFNTVHVLFFLIVTQSQNILTKFASSFLGCYSVGLYLINNYCVQGNNDPHLILLPSSPSQV